MILSSSICFTIQTASHFIVFAAIFIYCDFSILSSIETLTASHRVKDNQYNRYDIVLDKVISAKSTLYRFGVYCGSIKFKCSSLEYIVMLKI